MAEQEDTARLLAEVNRELEQYGRLTNDTAERLKYASTGIKNFEQKMNVASDLLGGLSKAFISYNKAVYNGEHGAKAFNGALDSMSDAVKQAAVGLAVLAPGGVVIKGLILAAGFLASKLMEAGKEVNEQTGKIFDAFQDLARAGAAAGDGMQGVFDGLQKMGLGVEQFEIYTRTVSENAAQLSTFGGTVAEGTDALENTVQGLRKFRTDLGVMGLDRTKVVEATAQYIRVQQTLTRQTKEQMDTSGDAVMRYVKETDLLTRITGASRKKQEEIMEESMSEEIFASKIDEMLAAGGEAAERAKNMQTANLLLTEKYGKETARAYRDSVSGFVGASDASKKFLMSFGAEGQQFVDRLNNTNMSAEELGENLTSLAKAGKDTNQAFQPLTQMGRTEDFLLSYKERRKADQVIAQDLPAAIKKAQTELNKQLNDPNARKMQEMLNAQQDEQLALQKTVNLGMSTSIEVMRATAIANKELAEAALRAAMALNLIGGEAGGGVGSAGGEIVGGAIVGGAYDAGGGEAAAIMNAGGKGVSGTRGATPTTGAGGIVSGITGAITTGLQSIGLRGTDYYLKGNKAGLDERLLNAMGLAAKEYGKPISINSGFRSVEEQAKMYQEWVDGGGGPGRPTVRTPSFGNVTKPARPGESRHQSGLALDIDQAIADELDQKGILAKYGLARPVPGDPVHVQLEKFEYGGMLGAGKMGIAGEAGAELITGPASITPMNDLMREMSMLNESAMGMLTALKDIARKSGEAVDTSKRMLQVAQN